jgi:hypothetical protein
MQGRDGSRGVAEECWTAGRRVRCVRWVMRTVLLMLLLLLLV